MSEPIKIFTDHSALTDDQLKNLSPLLSYHWRGFDSSGIATGAHNPASPLRIVADAGQADFMVLPMIWSYYLWNQRRNMREAERLARLAAMNQKQIIVWHKGDLIPIIPFKNAIIFLPGIVRAMRRRNQRSCPVFVRDPAETYGPIEEPYRYKRDVPRVGFCGYASVSVPKIGWSILKGTQLRILSKLNGYDFEGVPIIPATFLRARALKRLSEHPMVDADFIIRDRHTPALAKPGSTSKALADLERVFYSNIYGTDYTLCLRGYGNWSYRFYETLACGRIPIFVDTDCVLPSVPNIDWKQYCVWVNESEIQYIGEKIIEFHSSLSPAQFLEIQRGCRELWERHLTLDGFMEDVRSYLFADDELAVGRTV